jgi:hypothetical protein
MNDILRNWKTTLAGLGVITVAIAFLMGRIDLHAFLAAFAVLGGGGLVAAKDGDKSGTSSGS